MLNGYKIVGVCVTRIQDEFCSGFLQGLFEESLAADYRLLVFNSFVDYFHGDKYEQGARSVYKLINFSVIDALVIVDHCFYDKELVNELVENARVCGIPVVVMYGDYQDCFCIKKDYANTYEELINHVIHVHGAKKLRFIAGFQREEHSTLRAECFRRVMEENGLEVKDSDISWCNYWEGPVRNTIEKWLSENDMPDALICSNDSMACMVCDCLAEHGLKVPDDVIVTGFDGLESLSCHIPRLTTCAQDIRGSSRQCLSVIRKAVEENAEPFTVKEKYQLVFSESCGCADVSGNSCREDADRLCRVLEEVRAHEARLYSWADRIHDSTDINVIGHNFSEIIEKDSVLVMNSNLLAVARQNRSSDIQHPFTDKMVIITGDCPPGQEVYPLSRMYPSLDECISEKALYIFQSVYAADEVCGYYALKSKNVAKSAPRLHRLCRIINLDFSVILGRIKQEHLSISIEKVRTRNPLTGLMNLKGLIAHVNQNYDEYCKKCIVVSVYAIPRYKYIIENFGVEDGDEAVIMTADALQLANTGDVVIAQIAEDEFVIINILASQEMVAETINHATSAFFNIIEDYNRKGGKDYYIEVNCGCVVASAGWEQDIMSFIKAANGEMYLNRIKAGNTPALKQEKSKEDYYRIFDLLIEKNLFIYHFQPIVDAHTGKVRAYEALMRTDKTINMTPAQILGVAGEYKRMYDIERATLFNVMNYMDSHPNEFEGKRVFINTIPGCFLNEDDNRLLAERFGHLFDICTIEITEQGETNDAELMQIKRLERNGRPCQLAVDDYGTGFSNIVNLLRYQPQVIKIDRYLITQVQNDTNKQLFISNTVEFARLNNILVLAEGVETKEELSKVIELGVDLIQGYYTGRPSADVVSEIDPKIAEFIVSENKRLFG